MPSVHLHLHQHILNHNLPLRHILWSSLYISASAPLPYPQITSFPDRRSPGTPSLGHDSDSNTSTTAPKRTPCRSSLGRITSITSDSQLFVLGFRLYFPGPSALFPTSLTMDSLWSNQKNGERPLRASVPCAGGVGYGPPGWFLPARGAGGLCDSVWSS